MTPFKHGLGEMDGGPIVLHAVEAPCFLRIGRIGVVACRDDPDIILGELALPIVVLRREPFEVDGHERIDHGGADGEGVDLGHAAENRGLGDVTDLMVLRHARSKRAEQKLRLV